MRGAARGLIVAAALLALLPARGFAAPFVPAFSQAVRGLDGGQFLEDEPIWVCDLTETNPGNVMGNSIDHEFALVGRDEAGLAIPDDPFGFGRPPALRVFRETVDDARVGEFVQSFNLPVRPEIHPLGMWNRGGLPAGRYEVRPVRGDTSRVLARFRIVPPRASELAVRAALARAARLAGMQDAARQADGARLYEAVLGRYPRTSYRSAIYAGLWRLRTHTSYAGREWAWLEEIFAHFHDSCFGTWALDVFMRDMPVDLARPRLKNLVGLYPDTPLSRAAARYL